MKKDKLSKHNIQANSKALLTKYPNIDASAMGFPTNWRDELFGNENK